MNHIINVYLCLTIDHTTQTKQFICRPCIFRWRHLDLERAVARDNNKPYYLDPRPNNVIFITKYYQYSTVSISGIREEKFG